MRFVPQKYGLGLAAANAVLVWTTVGSIAWVDPAWFARTWATWAGLTLPAAVLLAAGWLGRDDPGPARWGVIVAGWLCLLINLPKVDVLLVRLAGLPPGPGYLIPAEYALFVFRYTDAVGPVSLTAAGPAVVAWRQRRRGRHAESE